jgi:oxygen-independent coproporphyrinogen-3 oxidase
MMLDAMQTNGFEQYEISNFCKPGHYSRHNSNYWKGVKYLGIGPSAHSFNGDTRQWNIANNAKYIQKLNRNTPYPPKWKYLPKPTALTNIS